MNTFYKIIWSDYLQRTRSYSFLITLAISLYVAYSFLPAPTAAYTTVRVGSYIGVQNSAWIGYVTAMMTSVFSSWIGFYLINSNIKKDVDTGVGMITATTPITNFRYLAAKTLSNYLVLLSILGSAFLMAVALFFIRHSGYPFEPMQFIVPYIVMPIPALFFFSALAVAAEVFLYQFTILMNVGFFFFFCFLISIQINAVPAFDVFGVKHVTTAMQQTVLHTYKDTSAQASIGFNFGPKETLHHFVFTGIQWTFTDILSRVILIGIGFVLIFISSKFFHRFDIRETFKKPKKLKLTQIIPVSKPLQDIRLSALPPVAPSFRITPFIKTELLMLFRKGPRWLWLINLGGMVALIFVPLAIAHQIILPILWFLQVARWSDLATKEKTNRIHYFTYASYKPLTRLLPAQIIAGVILALALASPLLLRYLAGMQWTAALNIILGGIFIVLFAVGFGILSGGKKLFEILFFVFTYCNVNKVPFADYFGGMNSGVNYMAIIIGLIVSLGILSFTMRGWEIRHQ